MHALRILLGCKGVVVGGGEVELVEHGYAMHVGCGVDKDVCDSVVGSWMVGWM